VENIKQETIDIFPNPPEKLKDLEPVYSPDNPPWGILIALLLWAVSVLLIIVMPILFVAPYLFSQKVDFTNNEVFAKFLTSDITSILLQIGAIIPAHIITFVLAWFVITQYKKFSFKEMVGWDFAGYNTKQIILIFIGLILIVFAFAIGANAVFGTQDNDLMMMLRKSRYIVFLVAFLAIFTAPIVEEVIYRGVLYSAFQKSLNVPLAVFLVTLVFAAVHFPQYWGDTATIVTLLFLSLVLTLMRVWTKSLLPCIAFHFIFNAIQSVLLILQPYLPENLDPNATQGFFFLS